MSQIMAMLATRMSSDIKTSKARVISQLRCTSIQNEKVAQQQGRKCVRENEIN